MGELVNLADYRKKRKAKIITRILDIQMDQLCWSQQSAQRGKLSLKDTFPKHKLNECMYECDV